MTIDRPFPRRISRVAVIGAGPGGMAAAHALQQEATFEAIVVFECHSKVGGLWNYSSEANAPPPMPSTDCFSVNKAWKNEGPLRTAVYDHLHTNLPSKAMAFTDEPFPAGTPMFPPHNQVLSYLQHYTRVKDIEPVIRFNTRVTCIEPTKDGWKITSTTLGENPQRETTLFDAVVVATGKETTPYVPAIEGFAEALDIEWLHARDYRRPDAFANKTVLVIGGGFSGTDIAREASVVAKKVYHCIRSTNILTEHARQYEKSIVQRIGALCRYEAATREWACENGERFQADAVVFATGYLHNYPFFPLELQKDLLTDGKKVRQLYRFQFYKRNPTLVFIGLPVQVVPFVFAQAQAVVTARVWNGKIPLPLLVPDEYEQNEEKRCHEPGTTKEYIDMLRAWVEGCIDGLEDWGPTEHMSGRLALRKEILDLRAQQLGFIQTEEP